MSENNVYQVERYCFVDSLAVFERFIERMGGDEFVIYKVLSEEGATYYDEKRSDKVYFIEDAGSVIFTDETVLFLHPYPQLVAERLSEEMNCHIDNYNVEEVEN